jgi:transposase
VATLAVTERADLTGTQWAVLEPLLPVGRKSGRPPTWTKRQLINGIRWRVRADAPWRDVPPQYGPWQTVYGLFRRWLASPPARWPQSAPRVNRERRERAGQLARPGTVARGAQARCPGLSRLRAWLVRRVVPHRPAASRARSAAPKRSLAASNAPSACFTAARASVTASSAAASLRRRSASYRTASRRPRARLPPNDHRKQPGTPIHRAGPPGTSYARQLIAARCARSAGMTVCINIQGTLAIVPRMPMMAGTLAT